MAANRNRRVQKELQDILKDTTSGISITPPNQTSSTTTPHFDDLTHFHGHFLGPPDTPYERGNYSVDITLAPEYPFKPPRMKFITKIWHPNVSSQTGAICLDTLGTAWSPVLTLKSALISLQSLLSSPEPKDPLDAEVAAMLLSRPEQFNHIARDWAVRFAGAPVPPPGSAKSGAGSSGVLEEGSLREREKVEARERKKSEREARERAYRGFNKGMIDRFVEMGFTVERVVAAFEDVGIDRAGGEEYELEEEYMGDVTARLFDEM
ncbi:Ubiquitin-conjugating enzyme E2 1 [Oleoguttula sp. CCFEE 5521]